MRNKELMFENESLRRLLEKANANIDSLIKSNTNLRSRLQMAESGRRKAVALVTRYVTLTEESRSGSTCEPEVKNQIHEDAVAFLAEINGGEK